MPFELPEGWVWITLEEISSKIGSGSTPKGGNYSKDGIPFFRSQNVYNEGLVCADMKFISNATHKRMIGTEVRPKDLLLNITGGSLGRCAIVSDEFQIGNVSQHVCIIRPIFVLSSYVHSFILSSLFKKSMNITGSGREGLPKYNLEKMFLPLPPLTEQTRIVTKIEHWTKLIDAIEQGKIDLQIAIKQAKSKILELAIHGKLVPQNPAEEPASELLKRINPKAEIACDNEHYPQLPKGWSICRLEDVIKYEQPTAYIVESTAYRDDYLIPVLTAGKSFVIGYTDEKEGIYNKLPCIIFDDFTTDSRLVDFPFKVKSSAMKILQVCHGVEIEYVALFMSRTRLVGDTHKRYWISEYSKLEIPIPPQDEQKRIVKKGHQLLRSLGAIEESL